MKTNTIGTVWEVWTYDVWGNAQDGYDVNDRYCLARKHEIELTVQVNNAGTPREFLSGYPTDKQIRETFDIRPNTGIDLDGDDITIYVRRERDGYPIGELVCTSHKSLSPIQAKG
jgi:hypothetical protein